MSFICHNCGEEWAKDPRLSVPCPVPHCRVGAWADCKRPSGHTQRSEFGGQPHVEREALAVALGKLGRCMSPKLTAESVQPPQADLFSGS